MSDEQRAEMKRQLRGGIAERAISFADLNDLTQVILVASGKGGVGKSSVTVNLAMALAEQGKPVGVRRRHLLPFDSGRCSGSRTTPRPRSTA